MIQWFKNKNREVLEEKYCRDEVVEKALAMLSREDQSEEGFLGAQGVLMLCGLI